MTTYYTPKAGMITLYALVLTEDAKTTKETERFMTHADLDDHIRGLYPDVRCVSYAELQQILLCRKDDTK